MTNMVDRTDGVKGVLSTKFSESDYYEDESEGYEPLSRLPEIIVRVYERELKCLIDTGSQLTCITQDLYDSIRASVGNLAEV